MSLLYVGSQVCGVRNLSAGTSAGINIYRVEGGKIAEELYLGDRLGLWQQLGLVPTSRKLAAEVGHAPELGRA